MLSISRRALRPSVAAATASSFDVFAKLKDSPSEVEKKSSSTGLKRKPSERVLRLTEEVLGLSLIEAADLCDLCSERLGGPKGGVGAWMGGGFPGAGFPGAGFPVAGFPGAGFPGAGMSAPQTSASPGPASPTPPVTPPPPSAPATPQAPAAKSVVSIKLVSYDAAKKVQCVKEVRTLTALGLKEAKEAVEAAPRVLKKGVPAAEAAEFKKKLEEAGGVVELE